MARVKEKLNIGDFVMIKESKKDWYSKNSAGKVGVINDTNCSGYSIKGVGAWYSRESIILIRSCDYSVPSYDEFEDLKPFKNIWK